MALCGALLSWLPPISLCVSCCVPSTLRGLRPPLYSHLPPLPPQCTLTCGADTIAPSTSLAFHDLFSQLQSNIPETFGGVLYNVCTPFPSSQSAVRPELFFCLFLSFYTPPSLYLLGGALRRVHYRLPHAPGALVLRRFRSKVYRPVYKGDWDGFWIYPGDLMASTSFQLPNVPPTDIPHR
ncbi:hypothetical protein C8J57DRAFT_1472959 [Mycena rebaudengoi]|nr:hypothetical protein C8J57DRAFT_1472959 [Mycena rebaudengoi]